MKKFDNNVFLARVYFVLMCLALVISVVAIVAWVYALVVYAGKPITEIPFWALLFLGRK